MHGKLNQATKLKINVQKSQNVAKLFQKINENFMKDIIHHGTACIYKFCGTAKKDKQILLLLFLNMEKKQQLIALHNVHLAQLYKCLRDIPIIVCKEDRL